MNKAYFTNVIQVGDLYLDHVLYEFESEPILFTCVDKAENIYLCICSEIRYCQRWIVAKCDMNTLWALYDEQMDIASAFLLPSTVIHIQMDLQGKERSSILKRDKVDRLDLPEEGTYVKCDKDMLRRYLENKEYNRSSRFYDIAVSYNVKPDGISTEYCFMIEQRPGDQRQFEKRMIRYCEMLLGMQLDENGALRFDYQTQIVESYSGQDGHNHRYEFDNTVHIQAA